MTPEAGACVDRAPKRRIEKTTNMQLAQQLLVKISHGVLCCPIGGKTMVRDDTYPTTSEFPGTGLDEPESGTKAITCEKR